MHTLFLLIVLGLVAAFASLNWTTINTPTTLSLGFTSVQGPLGLLLLGLLVALALLFLSYVAYLQSTALIESRRQTRELQTHRELADKAEASRFTELRTYLESELQKQNEHTLQMREALFARMDRAEERTHTFIEQSGNSIAAQIAEVDDRVERKLRA